MNVIVCVKQVPGTTEVKMNKETNTIIREGVESIINPFDVYAVEEGIRIREKTGGGRVTVEIVREGAEIVFRVKDDGVGMTAERLREVLADGAPGIGLRNIRRRLQLEYRQTLHVTSRPGEGTAVRFSLPLPDAAGPEINTGGGSPHDPSIAGR